jgi:hypothetical protein
MATDQLHAPVAILSLPTGQETALDALERNGTVIFRSSRPWLVTILTEIPLIQVRTASFHIPSLSWFTDHSVGLRQTVSNNARWLIPANIMAVVGPTKRQFWCFISYSTTLVIINWFCEKPRLSEQWEVCVYGSVASFNGLQHKMHTYLFWMCTHARGFMFTWRFTLCSHELKPCDPADG